MHAACEAASSPVPGLRAVATLLLVLACGALCGCAGARYVPVPPVQPVAVPGAVTSHAIFAPTADAAAELEQLPRSPAAPIALRRAYLELELGHARAAIDATSQVLYGNNRPSANEEAFARYLRAQAYILRGTADLAEYDLLQARQLAMDPGLVRRLGEIAAAPAAARNAVHALGVRGRDQWGAAAPNRGRLDAMDRASRVTVHHSAMYFRSQRPTATAAHLQRIQREHMQGRGYGDIGYHYLIDPAGRVWQGREMKWQGAHASGRNNVRNVGICVLGNFVRGAEGHGPTQRQVGALRRLIVALMHDHGIPARAIHRHSDFKATECPGPLLEPIVTQLARELARPEALRVATPTP